MHPGVVPVCLFVFVFVFEGHRGLVAHFRRAEVLDWAGVDVACVVRPCVAFGGELEEGCSVEAHERFLNHGFVFGVSAFDVHHHGDGYAAGNPLNGGFHEVAHCRHVAGDSGVDECGGVVAQ